MNNQNIEPNLQQQPSPVKPKKPWYKKWWIWVIIGAAATCALAAVLPKDDAKQESSTVASSAPTTGTTEVSTEATTVQPTTIAETTAVPTEKPTEKATEAIPMEYQNALKSANEYLNYTAFSKEGLYNQLKHEKYSDDAARYAVDHVNADWKECAVKAAESYLAYSSFSKEELYDQLIYEKYTEEEARYAVDKVYQ